MITAQEDLNLKTILLVQTALAAVLTAAVYRQWGLQLGASFGIGGLLMLVNLLLLAWIWSRVVEKKSIAWTVVIIVSKYTVLLTAVLFLTQLAWFHVLSAGLGLASFVMAALLQTAAMSYKWE